MADMVCRFCGGRHGESFVDLGMSPLSNRFIPPDRVGQAEKFYPLHAHVCAECRLVQLAAFESPEAIFSDYPYFSSMSETWLRHAEAYAGAMVKRLGLGTRSLVVEIASNDGYLLQYFRGHDVPVLGIEPAANVAEAARMRGISTETAFFGAATAARLREAGHAPDLVVANNVLAHVPELNDFVAGLKILLATGGVLTLEFPHLLRLITENQFDTIYHEHFSYFSLLTAERVLARHGLAVFDVAELPTHGGSLRLFARHAGEGTAATPALAAVRAAERDSGLEGPEGYRGFAARVADCKCALLDFLITARRAGRRVLGYGAPAKGNTLLNYCGIGPELLPFTVDRSPHKQGMLLPGTHIPVRAPAALLDAWPDYVLILPWNLEAEITTQMAGIRAWGGRFVVPVPGLRVLP